MRRAGEQQGVRPMIGLAEQLLNPTQLEGTSSDSSGVNEAGLRESLRRWFGYGPRWRLLLDDAFAVVAGDRPAVILAPVGAAVGELASLLQTARREVVVVPARSCDAQEQVRVPTSEHDAVFVLEGEHSARVVSAATEPARTEVLRIPTIAQRRDDLAWLLAEARVRAEAWIGLGRASLRDDMQTLYAHRWPGHLNEIERVLRLLVALRVSGSLRAAARLLHLAKSTLSGQLHAVGVQIRPR
jgi:hypothetical protein